MPDLKVISARGVVLEERAVDEVVVRRREPRFDLGSEVAVLPGHAPLAMQTCACALRWRRGDRTWERHVGAGVLEVCDEQVTLAITEEDRSTEATIRSSSAPE